MKSNCLFTSFLALSLIVTAGSAPGQTTLYPLAEAAVRDGNNFNVDINEASLGYLMVKYSTAGSSGKTYLKFDFTGQTPNTNDALTLTFTTYNSSQRQHAQVWALDQAYAEFTSSALVWSTAQANETNGNALLTDPATTGFTATPLIDFLSPTSAGATMSVAIPPPWGPFIIDNELVLVVASPFNDPVNLANGFRMKTNATFVSFAPLIGSPPSITSVSNITVMAGQMSDTREFTVSDAEDSPDFLSLSASSSNENIVPSGNIGFSGTGAQRGVYLYAGGTPGTATVTVKVTDTAGNSALMTFEVTVLPLNYPPIVSTPAPVFTQTNTPITVSFAVEDPETAAADLTVSGDIAAYSTALLDTLSFGGSGSNRTVTITPVANADGAGVVDLNVADADGAVTKVSFPVMVLPGQNVVFNEHFDYPDGKLFVNSAALWTRRNSQAQSVNLNTSAQQAFIRPKSSADDGAAPLAGGPYRVGSGAVLYTIFNATWLELPDVLPAVTNSVGSFLQLLNNPTANSAALSEIVTTTNAVPEGFFQVGLLDLDGQTQPYTQLNLVMPSGAATTSHKLITRYDVDTGTGTIWVDATTETDPSVSSTDILNPVSISYVGLRQDLGMGYIYIDDLTVKLLSKPNITTVAPPSGGNVELTFAGGPGDTVSSFVVEYAPALGQPFADATATITALGDGTFSAATAAPGAQGFYRIRHAPVSF